MLQVLNSLQAQRGKKLLECAAAIMDPETDADTAVCSWVVFISQYCSTDTLLTRFIDLTYPSVREKLQSAVVRFCWAQRRVLPTPADLLLYISNTAQWDGNLQLELPSPGLLPLSSALRYNERTAWVSFDKGAADAKLFDAAGKQLLAAAAEWSAELAVPQSPAAMLQQQDASRYQQQQKYAQWLASKAAKAGWNLLAAAVQQRLPDVPTGADPADPLDELDAA